LSLIPPTPTADVLLLCAIICPILRLAIDKTYYITTSIRLHLWKVRKFFLAISNKKKQLEFKILKSLFMD